MKKTIYSKEQQVLVKKIIQARLDAGLTQEDVANKLDVTQSYISKFESGQRKIDLIVLKRLARIYNKDVSYFL